MQHPVRIIYMYIACLGGVYIYIYARYTICCNRYYSTQTLGKILALHSMAQFARAQRDAQIRHAVEEAYALRHALLLGL